MAVINAIEDNHEFQTELHITSFDKKKAFDAPFRLGGLWLAYMRVIGDEHYINFAMDCDKDVLCPQPHYCKGF